MILEMYLNSLTRIEDLKIDQVFENFLTLKGPQFEKSKQQYKKLEVLPPSKVAKPEGEMELTLQPNTVTSLAKFHKFL